MQKNHNQKIRKAILEVINNQIQDNNPPETREALTRLKGLGFSENEALKLIGHVVVSEVFTVLKEKRSYDRGKYIAALNALPKLPWEQEG
jgi:hypothetical protein